MDVYNSEMEQDTSTVDIPDLVSPCSALYIHAFVEWNSERAIWVSENEVQQRQVKMAHLRDFLSIETMPSIVEMNWLACIEEDPKVNRQIRRLLRQLEDRQSSGKRQSPVPRVLAKQ